MNLKWKFVPILALLLVMVQPIFAEEKRPADGVHRYPILQFEIRSWKPSEAVSTYRSHSSGTCGVGGSIEIGAGGANGFHTEVRCVASGEQIAAEVAIRPASSNKKLKASQFTIDLSDMRPSFKEVTKNADGRVYFLVIEPEIVEAKLLREFQVDDLSPFSWDFQNSPVVLDDEVYVGRMGMGSGSLVGITIAGVADLQFSLQQLKNSRAIGVLQNGTLTILYKGTEIVISGVRNGAGKQTLPGPYKVWVRPTDEDVSMDQYKRMLKLQLEAARKKQADGDESITDEMIERFEKFIVDGRPMLIGTNSVGIREKDLVKKP